MTVRLFGRATAAILSYLVQELTLTQFTLMTLGLFGQIQIGEQLILTLLTLMTLELFGQI